MNSTLKFVVIGLAGVMILLLVVVFVLVLQNALSTQSDTAAPTLAPTAQVLAPTGTLIAELPPPELNVPATFTPPPTSEPSDTPEQAASNPTNTPAPTNTLPPPTPTNSPVPVVLPTNTSAPPPPTNTPSPPTPVPQDTRGLVATNFALQDRSDYRVNQSVWFEFNIVNNTGGEVPYSALGVLPRKSGADRGDWFQQSWGGSGATIKPEGLEWEDRIKLPESGTYTLRLVICFDNVSSCKNGQEAWVTLSEEIPVTIS